MAEESKKRAIVGQIVVAVVVALLAGGTAPWWWNELFGPSTGAAPEEKPPPPRKFRFEVIELNPFTGGEVNRASYKNAQRAAYSRACSTLKKVHWVRWKFVGISEPFHTKRFASSQAAQRFIDSGGPLKPFRILAGAATIHAARVSCREIPLPPG